MKRLLVTGLDGFVGEHVRQAVEGSRDKRFELVIPRDAIELRDRRTIEEALKNAQPDCVLHLAAQSFIPASVKDPQGTYEVNFFGTFHLLQALKARGFSGRVLYVGSADVYGAVPDDAYGIRLRVAVANVGSVDHNGKGQLQSAHHLDIAQWGLGMEYSGPVE